VAPRVTPIIDAGPTVVGTAQAMSLASNIVSAYYSGDFNKLPGAEPATTSAGPWCVHG
jgi:hypothetical protein